MASMNWNFSTADNLGDDNSPKAVAKDLLYTPNQSGIFDYFKEGGIDYSVVFGEAKPFSLEDYKSTEIVSNENARGFKDALNTISDWFNATALQVKDFFTYKDQNETTIVQDTSKNLFDIGKNVVASTWEGVKESIGKPAVENAKRRFAVGTGILFGVCAIGLFIILKRK